MKRVMISMMIVGMFLIFTIQIGYADNASVEAQFKNDAKALHGDTTEDESEEFADYYDNELIDFDNIEEQKEIPKVLIKPDTKRIKYFKDNYWEDYDEMENIIWFKRGEYTYRGFDFYIGNLKDKKIKVLRFRGVVRNNNWIFFDKIIIMADEKRYVIDSFKSYDKVTDVEVPLGQYQSIQCCEIIDLPVALFYYGDKQNDKREGLCSLSLDDAINIVSASKVKIRFSGKYYSDFTLSNNEKERLFDTLHYYLWVLTDIGETYYEDEAKNNE